MSSFDSKWEDTYLNSSGKHLNKYPYGQLVTYFFRNLKNLPNKVTPNILELGCGTGNNLPLILNEGFNAYGIDGSKSAIEISKTKLTEYKNCTLEVMDLSKLNYENYFFDMIIDRQSIYANIPQNIELIFQEVSRVLKKDGIFISFMYNINDYHHKKILNDKSYAQEIDTKTYTNFKGGTFKDNGVVHFFTMKEIEKLCFKNKLEILSLSENKIVQLYPSNENKLAEYILVAKRC